RSRRSSREPSQALREVIEHFIDTAKLDGLIKVPLLLFELEVAFAMRRPAGAVGDNCIPHLGGSAHAVDPSPAVGENGVDVGGQYENSAGRARYTLLGPLVDGEEQRGDVVGRLGFSV